MTIFSGIYADNYDLFYRSKDYKKESDFVLSLAAKFNVFPEHLLDLGCGTGKHAIEWAKKGITVKALDYSDEMLIIARKNLEKYPEISDKLSFSKADIGNFDTENEKYALVTAMFAVLGYLTTAEKLDECFKTISKSLRKGGLFICDTWHGTAVLSEKPSDRIQQFDLPDGKLFRIVQSELKQIEQIVNVKYNIIKTGSENSVHEENHSMRFFLREEMRLFGKLHNLEMIHSCSFLNDREIAPEDWNVHWVFRKM